MSASAEPLLPGSSPALLAVMIIFETKEGIPGMVGGTGDIANSNLLAALFY
jgi:hypothetical protein